eukprot:jgi/Astpho2/7931/Aster-06405
MEDHVQLKLVQSGELDRLKDLLSQRLMECGWVEEVKERMQEVFKERQQQGQSPSSADLVQAVKPFGRSSVPDAVKAELLAKLTDFIA